MCNPLIQVLGEKIQRVNYRSHVAARDLLLQSAASYTRSVLNL